MSRTCLVVRHVPYEGVAGFRLPIEQAGYRIGRIDVTDPAFPASDFMAPDLLVMMGGPMGVYETNRYPWIADEVAKLGARLRAGRPTLGVCLGSQMIAAAAGARVFPGPIKEVGFGTVELTKAGAASPLAHLAGVPLLHWHGDTFDLPAGAELLARTAHYPQAFAIGHHALALQCHAEMGEDPRFESWLGDEAYQHAAGTDAATLRADHDRHGPGAVAAGRRMLAEWLAALD